MKHVIAIVFLMSACDAPGDRGSGDALAPDADADVVTACPPGQLEDDAGTCAPVVIDCGVNPEICGAFGRCDFIEVPIPGTDHGMQVFSQCTCDEGHAGDFCEACAAGFQANGFLGRCQPDCTTAALACVAPRACDDNDGVATCVCPRGTTGAQCELCALGYVASGASCVVGDVQAPAPSCTSIAASGGCGHGTCADGACQCAPGWAGPRCRECAPGTEGDDCSVCMNGWLRLADGPCRPSCHPNSDSCGPNGFCWDQETLDAVCQCAAGYVGARCDECDNGFDKVGDACVAALGVNERFFTIATFSDHLSLAVIDTSSGVVRPIRTLAWPYYQNGSVKLAWDKARSRLYSRAPLTSTLMAYDPLTLEATTIATDLASSYMPCVAYDATRDRVLVMEGQALVSIDPTSGAKTNMTNLAALGSVNELVVDVPNDRLIVGHFGQLIGQYLLTAVSLTDFTKTELGAFPADFDLAASNQLGLALDGDALVAAGPLATSYALRRPLECRQQAYRVTGDAAYLGAPARYLDMVRDGTTVVTSTAQSGPELVAVGDFLESGETIDIRTTNPDIFVCPPSYFFENGTLHIAATARLSGLSTPSSAFTLVVEAGFPTDAVKVHVPAGEVVDPSLTNPIVRLYDAGEWAAERLGGSGFAGESWESNALRRAGWARGAIDATAPFVVHAVDGMDLMGLAGPR